MPIYEYECSKCGNTIEVIQKFSDKPLKKHAGCGGGLTKLISASGFQFKGTGWYVTDYGPGRKGSGESSEGGKETKAESKESKEAKESKESKESKDTSSNGNKEGSGGKTGAEKA